MNRKTRRIYYLYLQSIIYYFCKNLFQVGGSDGDIENGGDLEESDIEYDENVEGAGGRRPNRARHHSRRGRQSSSNRSGASNPDQYRYCCTVNITFNVGYVRFYFNVKLNILH